MKLQALVLENFRCFERAEFTFGDVTTVYGHNGAGKSTLAEAVVWCLWGTNIYGKTKQDESLMRLGAKSMAVTATFLLKSHKRPVTISRTRVGSKGSVQLVNGRKPTPGQIEGWFGTVQEFLSIFFPGYFSSLEPKDAKTVLSRCVPDVTKDEVLARMRLDNRELLANDLFVMGLDSVDYAAQRLRQEIKACEETVLRLEGQRSVYLSAIEKGAPKPFVSQVTDEERQQYEAAKRELIKRETEAEHRQQRLKELRERRESLGRDFRALRDSLPRVDTHCHTCGQPLPPDKVEQIRREVAEKTKAAKVRLAEMFQEGNQVKAEIEQLEALPKTAAPDAELVRFVQEIEKRLKDEHFLEVAYVANLRTYEDARANIERVRQELEAERQRLDGLQRKLKALQDFRFQYLRAQHDKLNGLFEHVRIHLTDRNKETGETRETFRITWKGRPYRLLSFSEKVRCDLEIGRVLAQAKGEPMPVYVDNAESVQRLFDETFGGQVIAAYVADRPLEVQIVSDVAHAQGA
ncbi:AAA family ATPase [Alicyclobacillus macrosporangiidus]|uniref:Nuclease SbcCD subunit C n=1 Tax=Alicyclobacillus macrosporangiidus TaxID=392015 RepID=A0A1I7KEW1_9BACL|nr:AAA family ATPase [Alicyclobacillus macrosporangiidus]SFU95967.1 exonuclease SbcC [Alicyclobacillus macrosporangiidus]